MFPIIPSHMLNGAPSTSIGKLALNAGNSGYTNAFWNVWTEDFLRRKYLSAATGDCSMDRSVEIGADTKFSESKLRSSAIKVEPKINKGSFAMEQIPKESKTPSFDCIDLSSQDAATHKSFISLDTYGYIKNDQNYTESVWFCSLSLAHDTYSHNAQLEITSDHRLRVKIVKNLVVDEEIQLWFSEEVLAILGIPFLTPANILGKNCYKCAECDKIYENPNPLKIHLATKCDRYACSDLWIRLNKALPLKSYLLPPSTSPYRHTTTPPTLETTSKMFSYETEKLRRVSPSYVPSTNIPHQHPISLNQIKVEEQQQNQFHQFQIQQQLHRLSAFRPVAMPLSPPQHQPFLSQPMHSFSHQQHNQHTPPRSFPPMATSNGVGAQGEKVVAAAAAQLETIVSNMGTSKQGHICIYCGKLYSRKYGLKIHIRTHTGFKPLKCKYCFRPFGDPSNLNKHIRLHVQEKSLYKCHLCSKILVRRRDLLRHMNIKHNINEANGSDDRFNSECDNTNDNMTISSTNDFTETNSSRSNSVSSDAHCDVSSNDEAADVDDDGDGEDFDVRVDVD